MGRKKQLEETRLEMKRWEGQKSRRTDNETPTEDAAKQQLLEHEAPEEGPKETEETEERNEEYAEEFFQIQCLHSMD